MTSCNGFAVLVLHSTLHGNETNEMEVHSKNFTRLFARSNVSTAAPSPVLITSQVPTNGGGFPRSQDVPIEANYCQNQNKVKDRNGKTQSSLPFFVYELIVVRNHTDSKNPSRNNGVAMKEI